MSETHHTDHRKSYYAVWLALLFFTVLTVYTASIDLSYLHHNMNIIIAMIIATIKATLVGQYFMHLKYDSKLNKAAFLSSFIFLGIFIALTASDLLFRPSTTIDLLKNKDQVVPTTQH